MQAKNKCRSRKDCRNGEKCKNGRCKKRSKGKRNGAKRSRQNGMGKDQNYSRKELRQRRKKTRKIQEKQNGNDRQVTGNATSCAMKAIKYARLFEGKATSISRQVTIWMIVMMVLDVSHPELENVKSFTRTNINKPDFTPRKARKSRHFWHFKPTKQNLWGFL